MNLTAEVNVKETLPHSLSFQREGRLYRRYNQGELFKSLFATLLKSNLLRKTCDNSRKKTDNQKQS